MTASSQFNELSEAVAQSGFMVRGGFHAQLDDALPTGVASVVLIGSVGKQGFDAFRNSPEWACVADPMDRYTERVIGALAQGFGARVVYPQQGPPWWPFQRWAQRVEAVYVSPLQILIHPQYGLWHAYRAALMFDAPLGGLPIATTSTKTVAQPGASDDTSNPCTQCSSRPCLSACPVGAFDGHGFERSRCEQHLRSPAGRRCMDEGCAARKACPVAPQSRYGREQQQFHMRAFLQQ